VAPGGGNGVSRADWVLRCGRREALWGIRATESAPAAIGDCGRIICPCPSDRGVPARRDAPTSPAGSCVPADKLRLAASLHLAILRGSRQRKSRPWWVRCFCRGGTGPGLPPISSCSHTPLVRLVCHSQAAAGLSELPDRALPSPKGKKKLGHPHSYEQLTGSAEYTRTADSSRASLGSALCIAPAKFDL
jgi:hypothetical protein